MKWSSEAQVWFRILHLAGATACHLSMLNRQELPQQISYIDDLQDTLYYTSPLILYSREASLTYTPFYRDQLCNRHRGLSETRAHTYRCLLEGKCPRVFFLSNAIRTGTGLSAILVVIPWLKLYRKHNFSSTKVHIAPLPAGYTM